MRRIKLKRLRKKESIEKDNIDEIAKIASIATSKAYKSTIKVLDEIIFLNEKNEIIVQKGNQVKSIEIIEPRTETIGNKFSLNY